MFSVLRLDLQVVLDLPPAEPVGVDRSTPRIRAAAGTRSASRSVFDALTGTHVADEARRAEAGQGIARPRVGQSHELEVVGADVLAPVVRRDRALRLPVDGDERVVLVLREVADARGERAAELLAVALVRRAAGGGRGDAGVLLAQDDVDHARDRVGAVDRGRAVLQDLDALDGVERHLVQVDERPLAVVGQPVDGEPAAVDQHERVVRAEPAQRHAGRPGAEAVDERVGDRAVVVRGDRLHDRGDRLQPRGLDVLARDRLDRRRGLGVDALDVGAGHVDLDVLRQRGPRHQQRRCEREGRKVLLHRGSPW